MSNHFIAIDTGSNGAVCSTVDRQHHRLWKLDCTDDKEIKRVLDEAMSVTGDLTEVIIERPPYFMGTIIPSSRIAVLFECYGGIKGFFNGRGISYRLVDARVWQEPFRDHLGYKRGVMKHSQWKKALTDHAKINYPCDGLTGHTADALLLARWRLLQPI